MFELNLKDEEILMKITTTRLVTTKDLAFNLIGNLITRAGGDIADKVNLILTKDTIYLEYKGHAAIGYGEETRKIEEIELSSLQDFFVTIHNNEELIEIKISSKNYTFVRDNAQGNNLALAMGKVIKDMKKD